MRNNIAACLVLFCIWMSPATADESTATEVADVTILELQDGSTVNAASIEDQGDTVIVITDLGVRMQIPVTAIVDRRLVKPDRAGRLVRAGYDPTHSRLLLAPTGRPLARGRGYISDHFFFFPAVAYGVTNHFSMLGGMSAFPGVGLSEQVRYIAPRYARHLTKRTSISAGSLIGSFGSGGDGGTAGVGFLMATHGDVDQSITLGLGLGWAKGHDDPARFLDGPIIGFGFQRRLKDHLAVVSESWLITGEGVDLGQQPFGVALRFFSGALSVDLGALLIGELLQEGFPIPWLSFAYHFGR
ncbi:MAG: hypothetical protein HN712_16400 [Gemmatimonadetes bacterium]|jgi:hypothetical protein|nr:hypothetical protein [Gemmatimonadota bacterium]MBT7861897.1 hypothetical protein [Gemmatimonadota bacterium]